jgi:hypothetical protein
LLPYPPDWPTLAQALQAALGGDGGPLDSAAYSYIGLMADGQFSNLLPANTAIVYADGPFPSAVTAYEHLAAQITKVTPDFPLSAWRGFNCAYCP